MFIAFACGNLRELVQSSGQYPPCAFLFPPISTRIHAHIIEDSGVPFDELEFMDLYVKGQIHPNRVVYSVVGDDGLARRYR